MMRPWIRDELSPTVYAVVAPLIVLSQHLGMHLLAHAYHLPLQPDILFWLAPLRAFSDVSTGDETQIGIAIAISMAASLLLPIISYRRANHAHRGHLLAVLTFIPVLQIVAVPILIFMPRRVEEEDEDREQVDGARYIIHGVLAGMTIIVAAVALSTLVFRVYGWGLFVLTPVIVGMTTAYLANRNAIITGNRTFKLVCMATALGSAALIPLSIEGAACLVLASPIGFAMALIGAAIGRHAAKARHKPGSSVMSISILPLVFAGEAALPPSIPVSIHQSIVIQAPPERVWKTITSDARVASPPAVMSVLGLAYPIRGRLLGTGVGATRIGEFSTGNSVERITDWRPGSRLSFAVLVQPPMMHETSPYRHVHATHDMGYFVTTGMSYDLKALPGGTTLLTIDAASELRIDPVFYWEPLARWAATSNVRRVLSDIQSRSGRGKKI